MTGDSNAQTLCASSGDRFPPYPSYRESGVKWLGEIPDHWEVKKVTHLFLVGSGTTPPTDHPEYYGGEIPWVTTSELRESVVAFTEKSVTKEALRAFPALNVYPKGSVAVAMYGATIGRVGVLGTTAVVNQACCVFYGHNGMHTWFWFYWLQSRRPYLISLSYGGGQPNLSQELLKSIRVPTPTPAEQLAIAKFLDRETGKIDALVAKKEQLIELMQEKRVALITQAVTKGLNPDVPMKDSGVEWLGEIPAHWDVSRCKQVCTIRRGASPRPIDDPIYFDENGEYGWVRIADVTVSGRYLEKTTEYLSDLGKSKSVPLDTGELIISMAASVGKPIITKMKCCIHDGFVHLGNSSEDREYLYYVFLSGQPYSGLGKQGTQLNLNTETIGNIMLPIPPIDRQREIVVFLDRETQKSDAIVEKARQAIDRLKELRTALISAAVTGKIDVRKELGSVDPAGLVSIRE